ncbi:hypothetical protein [Rhizobium phage RHph_X2_30]|nr:hypothetical protein [Rhizobium phage RHph_X2_30]
MSAYSVFHGMVGREITGVSIDGKSYSIEAIKSALSRPEAIGDGVGVKELEWRPVALIEGYNWLTIAQAETPFGRYTIDKHDKGFLRVMFGNSRVGHFEGDDKDEAKAAAQTDYEQRIRSALVEGSPLLEWAVFRWNAEVKHRPLVNVHRRSLDDAWRQVIRWAGGDPDKLIGPSHDELIANAPTPAAAQPITVVALDEYVGNGIKIADRKIANLGHVRADTAEDVAEGRVAAYQRGYQEGCKSIFLDLSAMIARAPSVPPERRDAPEGWALVNAKALIEAVWFINSKGGKEFADALGVVPLPAAPLPAAPLPTLTSGERSLLEWLSKEESSSLGECDGGDLTHLVQLGLAEIGQSPPGMHRHYSRVRLTEAGRAALSPIESSATTTKE